MKKLAMFVLGLVALVSLSGCASSGTTTDTTVKKDDSLKFGTFVAAKWDDGRYYLTTVTGMDEKGNYDVKFVDETTGTYPKSTLVIVPQTLTLKVGDVISAPYPASGKYFSGKVKELNDMGVLVEWDDGSRDSLLPRGRVVLGTELSK